MNPSCGGHEENEERSEESQDHKKLAADLDCVGGIVTGERICANLRGLSGCTTVAVRTGGRLSPDGFSLYPRHPGVFALTAGALNRAAAFGEVRSSRGPRGFLRETMKTDDRT